MDYIEFKYQITKAIKECFPCYAEIIKSIRTAKNAENPDDAV